jgi:hypothetical protein
MPKRRGGTHAAKDVTMSHATSTDADEAGAKCAEAEAADGATTEAEAEVRHCNTPHPFPPNVNLA